MIASISFHIPILASALSLMLSRLASSMMMSFDSEALFFGEDRISTKLGAFEVSIFLEDRLREVGAFCLVGVISFDCFFLVLGLLAIGK